MRQFKFRLESVRDLREHAEREQKDVLAREQHALSLLEQERDRLVQACRKWSSDYLRICSVGAVPSKMVRVQTYLADLRWRLKGNASRLQAQAAVVERARAALVEKMQERKTVDALYKKQLRIYRYEQKREMEKQIEEQVMVRYSR